MSVCVALKDKPPESCIFGEGFRFFHWCAVSHLQNLYHENSTEHMKEKKGFNIYKHLSVACLQSAFCLQITFEQSLVQENMWREEEGWHYIYHHAVFMLGN